MAHLSTERANEFYHPLNRRIIEMGSLNKVQLIGNLGQDPELKYLPSGDAVANLSIATTDRWKDKQTGEQQERTEWHRVAFFGKPAEVIAQYLVKGSSIYVEGSLQTRKWQDKEGNDRYTTEVKGQNFQFLDKKGESGNDRNSPAPSPDAAPAAAPAAPAADDDDIPF